ncbi:MAG: hypothetical protein K6T94_17065 [Paenibacillus sp.]|nr:hypothetical protein [Paenibacillus sp.]
MSSYIVKVIPNHVKSIPLIKERNELKNQLRMVTSNKELIDHLYDEVTFIDSGSNFEGIKCNHCLKVIETEWWSDQMEICSLNNFNDISITTPCCNSTVSLNQLEYIWPVGFARYVIEIMNPNEDEVIEIEKLIKNKSYKLIRAHY